MSEDNDTEEDWDEILKRANEQMEKELGEMEEVECLSDYVSDAFKEDGYKQNIYWEYDEEGDVLFASFLDKNLEKIVVFFDEDLEYLEG